MKAKGVSIVDNEGFFIDLEASRCMSNSIRVSINDRRRKWVGKRIILDEIRQDELGRS